MNPNDVLWDGGGAARTSPADTPQVYLVPLPPKGQNGTPEFFRLLAEPVRVWTHWVATGLKPSMRSMPCMGKACRWHDTPQRRRAYGAALRFEPVARHLWRQGEPRGLWTPVVVDLTEECWSDLVAHCCKAYGPDVPWRGMVLQLMRRNRRLEPKILERQVTDPMPDAFDVKPILERMWGLREQYVSQPQNVAGDGPATIPFNSKGA